MYRLRLISAAAVLLPAAIGVVHAFTKSYVVSFIYVIGALALLPLAGLPLGIAINLWRLKWPWPYAVSLAVFLALIVAAALIIGRGIDKLVYPTAVLFIEYLVCLAITSPAAGWPAGKFLLASLAFALPLALVSAPGTAKEIARKSAEKAAMAEREKQNTFTILGTPMILSKEYPTPDIYYATYLPAKETLERCSAYLAVTGMPAKEAKDALSAAEQMGKTDPAVSERRIVKQEDGSAVLYLRFSFKKDEYHTYSGTDNSVFVFLNRKNGILSYRYGRNHYEGSDGQSAEDFNRETGKAREEFVNFARTGRLPVPKGFEP